MFSVGERYIKEGEKWCKGTRYYTDGTEKKFDH
jgi:hypothetical protein